MSADSPRRLLTGVGGRRGWISRHVAFRGCQARLKVGTHEFTKSFSASAHGSERKAELAARAWLDALAGELPPRPATALRAHPFPTKRDKSLPVGISETAETLRSGSVSTRFQVCWNDGKRRRIKSFTIGCVDVATDADRRAALKKAAAFRSRYVRCCREGKAFDPRDTR